MKIVLNTSSVHKTDCQQHVSLSLLKIDSQGEYCIQLWVTFSFVMCLHLDPLLIQN